MRESFRKSVLYLTSTAIGRTSPPFSFQKAHIEALVPISSTFWALKYCTATGIPKEQCFAANYLINNFGFSPESALSSSNYVRFDSSQKPDSAVAFFRNYGFSDAQLNHIVRKVPKLLLSNPAKTLLPKLQYLLSKGASTSQLVGIVAKNPGFLLRSLENCIIPNYNLLREFLQSDQNTIATIRRNPHLLSKNHLEGDITFLLDTGVRKPSIRMLLRQWPRLINCDIDTFRNKIDEIRELGIDPRRATFVPALYAKELPKSMWESKVELYKKWGWTDEAIHQAFMKHSFCMLISKQKIEEGLDFFVNHLGWDPLVLARYPIFLSFSLKKRIIPRASVLQLLLSKDLIKSTGKPSAYCITEKNFLHKYVTRFKDEAPQLLKLYEEKMNLSEIDTR
ncbi:hypothetical protein VNO77_05764 [Canavalia gladiata]|uniref:Uncharacterized protein n=1 Tax=Canavalia gladiata TaxID=3824 RepID=A0AAN9MYY4_CANGL